MTILDKLSTEVGVLLVSKVVELVDNIELNCWIKRREKRTTPIVAFDHGFMVQENADTFPLMICQRQKSIFKLERYVVNGKVPQHVPFHFLSVSSEILAFAESF